MAKNKRNIILAILLVLILAVIALLIGRFTYSYFGAQVSEDLKSEGETTASGDTIIFSKGNNLSIAASTDNFYVGSGNLADTTNPSVRLIASNKTNEAVASYYAGIIINKNTFTYSGSNAELILTVRDENNNLVTTSSDTLEYVTVNGVSGFDITGKTGAFNIVSNHPISTTSSTTGTTHTWTFTLTFVNLDTDQSINENATLDMEVVLQRDEINMGKLSDYIINNVYTSDGENGLYYHDGIGTYTNASQEAGDNSYRYSGANLNNYVCFGSDAATCPDDNLYRIIGLFDDDKDGVYNIKLIKNTIYGAAYWSGASSNTNNTWESSSLNTDILNGNYLISLGNLAENIAITEWQVGGMVSSITNTVKSYYDAEVVSNSLSEFYSAKVGLMYVSDYGYATIPENWNDYISDTSYRDDGNNWLFSSNATEWVLTRQSDNTDLAFALNIDGFVSGGIVYIGTFVFRPVFYLNSDVTLDSGSGTNADPYRLQLI